MSELSVYVTPWSLEMPTDTRFLGIHKCIEDSTRNFFSPNLYMHGDPTIAKDCANAKLIQTALMVGRLWGHRQKPLTRSSSIDRLTDGKIIYSIKVGDIPDRTVNLHWPHNLIMIQLSTIWFYDASRWSSIIHDMDNLLHMANFLSNTSSEN